jgi:hypothetical protein
MVAFGLPTEHEEQAAFCLWAALQAKQEPALGLLFAIPNGGKRSIKTARALRAEGVRAGVPDLFLPVARGGYNGCFVEMKRSKGGSLSREQAAFFAELRLQGFAVLVCKGAQEAQDGVLDYLGGSYGKS